MALGKDYERQNCTLARALEVVGERWTLLIIRDAFYGVRRFSDFLVHLDIPRAVLAARLQTLVEHGVLDRRGAEYVLSPAGQELWPIVYRLLQWGRRNLTPGEPSFLFVHAECGTALDAEGGCPACGRAVPPDEVEIRPGPGFGVAGRDDAVTRALARPHPLLQPLAV